MQTKKLFIGLVFGGKSNEHEVSIKSARNIFTALNSSTNKNYFVTIPIYIDKSGFWWDFKSSESIIVEDEKDIIQTVKVLEDILSKRLWDNPTYLNRKKVT